MKNNFMDLQNPNYSYMLGFIQCDGHMRQHNKNKGSLTVELAYRDIDILHAFQKLTPYNSTISHRTRNTNYKLNYKSAVWSLFALEAREALLSVGMLTGKKSETIQPPTINYIETDYIRGLIDADGSVGIDARGLPFISFTSKSKTLATIVSAYIKKVTDTRINPSLNTRDTIYSITLFAEPAQKLMGNLYYKDCLCLKRKLKSVNTALKWKRPQSMRRCIGKRIWKKEEDSVVLSNSITEAAKLLDRTSASITMRRWRLLNKMNSFSFL